MAQTLGIYEDTEDQVSALRQKYAPKPAQDLGNSISPKVEQYYRDQYDYFKTTGDLPAYKSNEEIDAMQMPVKKETSALGRGFSNLADYAGFNITEDPEYIKNIAETNATKPFAQQMFEKRLGNKFTNIADAYGKDDFSGIAQNVIDTAGELGSNPGKLLSFMGEQAANQLPAIGGRLAGLATGAAIGSTFGPVGAVIGGLVGGFAGGAAGGFGTDYIAEKAAGVLEKVEDPNNIDEIRKVVMDSDVMDDVRKAARLHATEVGLTDAAVGLLTAGLVRSRLGTGFKTTTGLGLETAGEGYGEYRGQTAQVEAGLRESIDPADIGLEAIGGMATSAATVAMELPFGPAKDPALAEAKKISDLRLRIDPSKTPDVDYTQVVNPITKDKIEDSDIAKSAYKIAKYNKLPVGTQGKRVADDNIVQLIDKYILTDNPDVNKKRHAEDVVMSAGYGPTLERMQEEYTSAVKTNEKKTENKKTKQEVKQEVVEKNLELNQSPDVTPETPQKEKPTYKVKSKGKTVTIVTDPSRYKTIKGLDRAEKNLRNWIDIRTKSSQPVPQWANDAIEKYRVQRAVLQPTTPDTVEETNLNTIKDVVQNVQGETGREVAGTEIPTAVKPATDWRAELDKNLEVDNDAKVSKILERAGILEQVKARTDTPTIQDLTEEEVQQLDNTYSGGPEGVARIQALTGAATPEQAVAEGKQTTEKIKRTWVAKPNGQAYTSASGAKNSLKTVNKDLDPKKYEVREIEKGSKKYALYPVDSEAGYKIEKKKKGGYKTRIQSNVPFTPLTNAGDPVVNLSGSVNINGEMTPYTTTGRVQHDGEKIVIELDNGSWVDPKQYNIKVPFNAIDKAAPKVDEGGVVVQEKSQAEQAKVEEQQARQIEQEKKVAKQVESAEKAREKARQSITAKYESLVAKKPELGEMTDAQLQDFVQEVDNISEIRKPELRAKIATKVAERFSAMMGIPVTVQDITTVAEAYDEGVITPAEVAVEEPSPLVEIAAPTVDTKAEPEQVKQEVVQVAQDNIHKVQNEIAVSDKRFIANLPEQISYQDEDGETEFIDTILQEDGVTSVFVEEVDDYVPIDQISVADRVEYLKKYSDVGRDYTATAKTTIDAIDGVQDAQDELEQTTLEESGITEIKDPEASAQEQTTNQPTIIRTRQPISKAQSNYIRRRLYPMVSKLLNNVTDLDVIFVESAEDLKAYPNLQADNFSADGTRISTADGWFVELIHPDTRDKNLVIMMLDSKSNPEDVKRVLFHEVVGHYGMRKVLGDQQDGKWTKFLRKTVVTNRKAADAAFALKDRWAKHYLKKDADGKYTLVRDSEDKPFVVGVKQQGYIPVTDKNGNTMYAHADTMTKYMDEYIAEEAKKFVENKPTSKSTLAFFKRIIAYIRHSLRSVLGGELASKVTDNDIASLLETSYIRLFEDKNYLTLIDKSAQKTIAREGKGATKYLTGEINKLEPTWVPYQEASEQPGYSGVAASEGYGATNIQEIIDATLTQESSIGIIRQWRDNVTKLQTWISQLPIINKLSTNRGASKEFALNTLMRTARGKIYKAEMATRPLFKWMTKLDRPKLNEIMEAWLEGTPFTQITGLTRDQQRQLLTARNVLEDAQLTFNGIITGRTVDPETGDETVRKMLPDKWLDNTQGKYIHTMFFNTLHEYSGSGKAPSNMNYFKKKIANPVARAVLGEIKNPGMSIPYTVSLLARDAYLSRLMQDIVENSHDHNTHWTLDSRKTYSVDLPSGKRRLSLNSMKGRMDTIVADLNREDTLLTSPEQVEGLQRELEVLGQKYNEVKDEQLEQVKQAMIAEGGKYSTVTPTGKLIRVDRQPTDEEAQQYLDDNYVWVTKSSNPGLVPFHNKYVHKAVFEEFGSDTPLFDYETGGNSITAKLFKDMTRRGGMMEQGTMMWKLSKTGLNIPTYWIRNLVGNWFLLDTASSTPTALLAKTLSSEIADTLSGAGRRYGQYNLREWAAEFGVYSTTYGASELYFLKDKYQDWVKQDEAREHGNVFQMMGYGVKSSYIKFAEAVSEYHGVMEGIFKQAAMRDYVNRWEKQNGSFARLSPEAQRGVMAGAAEFAEEAIFDYQKVPEWVRRLRRTPLGTPFLTFNYKMASQLPRAMLKHPWKLGKYYAAPAVAASMLMGDMDEDEWEKVKEDLPWHMKNKSSVFVMPTKDANGKYQYWDMTYQYPSAFWIDMVLKVSNPQYDETWYGNLGSATTSDLGFLGGPVPQLVAAVLTNQDPFTKREIVPEGASEKEKMEARLTWLYSLWMPPSVTNTGVLGRSLNQAGIDLPLVSTGESLTKYGSDKETISQTIWRAAGFGAGGWSPQESRLSNYKRYQYQLSLITKRQASILKDRNMDVNKKQKLLAETHARIKDLRKHYAGE